MSLADLAKRQPPSGPRVLTIDLERVPGFVTRPIWHPSDAKRWNWIPPEEWTSEPRTVCFTAKWHGERAVFYAEWDSDDPHYLAKVSAELFDEADIVVTYNGARADIRWLQEPWDDLGLNPTPYKHVDLFRLQTRWARLRKSLSYLLDKMSLANKDGKYNIDEAMGACAGDDKMRRRLKRYNVQDVVITEQLFDRLRHLLPGINLGVYHADAEDTRRCPYCGKEDTLTANGWYTASVQRYAMFTCSACGGHSRTNVVKARVAVRGVR